MKRPFIVQYISRKLPKISEPTPIPDDIKPTPCPPRYAAGVEMQKTARPHPKRSKSPEAPR